MCSLFLPPEIYCLKKIIKREKKVYNLKVKGLKRDAKGF
jgi:hypothetical protein